MRLHLPALPHTSTTEWWTCCAYTQKVRRFATMMTEAGHEVFLYGGPENQAKCTEWLPLVSAQEQAMWWPDWDPETDVWNGFDVEAPWWKTFNQRAVEEITPRLQDRDLIGLIAGRCQAPIAAAFPQHVAMEWGVGYEGIATPFRAFESQAWMHHVYGMQGISDGQFFDAVVPNSYEPGEFWPIVKAERDYFLYLGRMTPRKGLGVVAEIAKHHDVITAGQGTERVPGAVHAGVVRGSDRLALLQNAKGVLVPTTYIEPFGGVCVEAMLCGTPVITTDWGAFLELVDTGVDGFRCRMLRDFLAAADQVDQLDRAGIATRAAARWTTPVVALQYERWLRNLTTLYSEGWYDRQLRGDPWAL